MGEMTKGKTKPKGHKSLVTQPTPAPNARARETDWGSAMELWLALIGNGETERHAASLVALDFPGVTRDLLRARANADPGGWGEGLAAAHGRKVADAERMLREIAKGPGPSATLLSVDPQLERVRASTLQWLLSKWDRVSYGDKVDATLSGPDGGPVQSEVVRYEYRAPKNALLDGDE